MVSETPRPPDRAERALRAADAIAQIGRVLVQAPSLKDASRQIARSVRTLLGARVVGICYLRTDSGEHVAVAVAGEVGPTLTARPIFSHGESTLGLAVHEGRPVVTADIATDPAIPASPEVRAALVAAQCRALLTLPLHIGDRVVGTLTVCDVAGRVYDDEDLRLAQAFADLAALVLENARLLGESEQHRAAAENLAAVGSTLALSLDMDEVAQQTADSVRALLGTEIAAVYRLEPESGSLTIVAISGETGGVFEKGMVCPPGVGFLGLATRERQPVATPDCLADPRVVYPPEILARLERTPFCALLALPLVAQERLVGALAIGARRGRVFTDDEIRLAEAFAGQAAVALENARLHAETEQRRQEAEAIADVARTINASLDLDKILERVAEAAKRLCGGDLAWVLLRDAASEAMVRRAWAGAWPRRWEMVRVEPGRGLGGQVLLTGRAMRTDNYAEDPRISRDFVEAATREGPVSVMAAPIRAGDRIEGLLYAMNQSPRPFTDRDEAFLQRLADQAAVAVRNAQLFAREQEARLEAEVSEQRFRTLVQSLGAVVWEAAVPDPATLAHESPRRFTFVSQRVEALLGYPVERWLIEPGFWERVLHPDDRERVVAMCRAAVAAGEGLEGEYRAVSAEGRVVWLHDSVTVVRDAEGRVRLRRGVMVDVTARKLDEARHATQSVVARVLAESPSLGEAVPRLLKALCEGIGWEVGEFWRVDADVLRWGGMWHTALVEASPLETTSRVTTFTRGVGLPGLAWATGRPAWMSDVLENERFLRAPYAAKVGLHAALAIPVFDADLVTGVLVFFGREVLQPDEKILGFMTDLGVQIGQFIERKRSEEERTRLFSAAEQAAESIIMTTVGGTIVYVNPAFERITGYTSAEALGRTPSLVKSGEHPREFYETLWRTILAGEVWHGEIVNRRKDGALYTDRQSIAPVRDARGRITHYVSIGLDVTASKGLEAQLRQSTKMEAVGRLAGGVAHDFNNLLTLILSYSSILLHSLPEGEPARRYAEAIENASERAAALTRQLLAFSRKQVLQPRVLDLNTIVANMERMLRRVIGEDIDLRTQLEPDAGRVKADPSQLEQVIMNLAVNARDAMPRGGRLTLETANVELDDEYVRRHAGATPGSYVVLAISDTGIGMDAETQSRIFEPFFTTKEQGRGSGLGLATVFGIVKQSGGNIWVYSEPGRGTTFRIYLPRIPDAAEPHAAEPDARGGRDVEARPCWETILLVEDAADVRELAAEVLTEKGYHVLEASHGDEALAIARRHRGPIHLVLTDVVMPGMTGPELAERLQALRSEVKVLFMSGYTANAHGFLENARATLVEKPFTPDSLTRRVREALDREPEE